MIKNKNNFDTLNILKKGILVILCMVIIKPASIYSQNNAFNFDGIDDYFEVSNASSLIAGSSQFSMSCWVYPTNTQAGWPDFDGIIGFRNDVNTDLYLLQLNSNTLEIRFRSNTGVFNFNYSGLVLNTWQHYTVTYDGVSLKLYKDGVFVNSTAASGTFSTNSTQSLWIGQVPFQSNPFLLKGSVDNVGLWNKTLSTCEVNDLFYNKVNYTDISLKLFYEFNQGIAGGANPGEIILNEVNGSLSGNLSGMPLLTGLTSNWVSSGSPINNATWTGTTDTNWNTATNWSSGVVPSSIDSIIIPNSGIINFPALTSLTTMANVEVLAGASVEISAGIVLVGVFTNNGTVILKNGAYLDDFSNECASFIGAITVETEAANGVINDQRLISSPVNTPMVSEIADDLNGPSGSGAIGTDNVAITVDDCNTPSLTAGSNYGNLFEFNETLVNTCGLDGWVVRSAGTLMNGKGYSAYLSSGSTFDFTGSPTTGAVAIPVTNSGSGIADGEGWNLIGNPYPSPLKRDDLITAGATDVQYHVTAGTYQGAYFPYMPTANIAIAQGIQAHFATSTTINLDNTMRSAGAATWYENENWFTHKLEISVHGNSFADKTILFYNNTATNGYEPMYDVEKRNSNIGQPTLSTFGANKNLALNGKSVNDLSEIVPLHLNSGANGSFTLEFDGLHTFGKTTIYLKDLLTTNMHNIENGDYSFTATTSDNEERFELIFIPEVDFSITKIDCDGNLGNIALNSTISLNDRSFELSVFETGFTITDDLINLNQDLDAGIYTMNVTDQFGGTQVYDFEIETANQIDADFTISSVNVQVGEIVSLSNTTTNSTNNVWNFGEGTSISNVATPTYVYTEAGIYAVSLNVSNNECSDKKIEMITVSNKTTGISTVNNEAISIHPNPVSDVLFIGYDGDISIEIVSILGAKVIETTNNKINMKEISSGVYFVYVYDNEKALMSVNKIVKK